MDSGRGHDFSQDGREYKITPIQNPTTGAAFENQPLSRLPLAAPLILQLDTWDRNGELIIPWDALNYMICTVTIQTTTGEDATMVRRPNGQIVTMLEGTLISQPYELESLTGNPGVYFIFPDIGVRLPGTFRLKCLLMPLSGGTYLDFCVTTNFDVVPRSQFNAPLKATTQMTRHFAEQGQMRFLEGSTLLEQWPDG